MERRTTCTTYRDVRPPPPGANQSASDDFGRQPTIERPLLRRHVGRYYTAANDEYIPWYGQGRVKGLALMQNPAFTYILSFILSLVMYWLDQRYDIICNLWFNYSHPNCKRVNPERYEHAQRDKLHKDFIYYEPHGTDELGIRPMSDETKAFLWTVILLGVLSTLKYLSDQSENFSAEDFWNLSWFRPNHRRVG